MKKFSGNSAWLFLLISGVALVALSIATFVNADRALGLLIYIAGFALCGMGAAMGVTALLSGHRDERLQLLTIAAGNALLGIFVMLFSQFALIFVGIALALDGVGAVLKALRRKKNEEKGWFVEVILGITFFALGVVVVVFHNAISQLIGSALGLLLLIAGLSLVIIALLTRNSQKGAAHAAASASLQDAYTDNHK